MEAGTGVIQEQQNRFDEQPGDFFVTAFKPHPLTQGLNQFAIYGGWPLQSRNAQAEEIARCSVSILLIIL